MFDTTDSWKFFQGDLTRKPNMQHVCSHGTLQRFITQQNKKNVLNRWHPVKEMFRTESANKKPRVNKKSIEFASDFHNIRQFLVAFKSECNIA